MTSGGRLPLAMFVTAAVVSATPVYLSFNGSVTAVDGPVQTGAAVGDLVFGEIVYDPEVPDEEPNPGRFQGSNLSSAYLYVNVATSAGTLSFLSNGGVVFFVDDEAFGHPLDQFLLSSCNLDGVGWPSGLFLNSCSEVAFVLHDTSSPFDLIDFSAGDLLPASGLPDLAKVTQQFNFVRSFEDLDNYFQIVFRIDDVQATPEPSTLLLTGAAGALLWCTRIVRRSGRRAEVRPKVAHPRLRTPAASPTGFAGPAAHS